MLSSEQITFSKNASLGTGNKPPPNEHHVTQRDGG